MEERKFLQLNDIEAYKVAFHLSNYVWNVVEKWEWFAKKTVGVQFVNAVDSISANISEGLGDILRKIKLIFTGMLMVLQRNVWTGMQNQRLET